MANPLTRLLTSQVFRGHFYRQLRPPATNWATSIFRFFGKKKRSAFDDSKKEQFCEAVADLLEVQLALVDRTKIKDSQGSLNRRAVGYIYGFIDAALRTIGQDMADIETGVSVTYQILQRLFPDQADEIMEFLIKHLPKDEMVMIGTLKGGQQYLDFSRPGAKGVAMGLVQYLLDGET